MKKCIYILQAIMLMAAGAKGQTQASEISLPVVSQPKQAINAPFQQYLQNNYQAVSALKSWQNQSQAGNLTKAAAEPTSGTSVVELSYRHDTWSGTANDWSNADSAYYSYSPVGLNTRLRTSNMTETGWNNFVQISYAYNNNNQEITYLNQSWNASISDWANVSQITYTYDNNKHCISISSALWDNGIWLNNDQSLYAYDSLGNRISQTYQTWNGSTGTWNNNNNYLYSYNGGQMLSYIVQSWTNSSWTNTQQVVYTYNGAGSVASKTTQTFINNNWVNYDMSTWTFDGNNNVTEVASSTWNTQESAWINATENIYTYDANNNNILEIDLLWNSINYKWDSSAYKAFAFNENNYPLSETDGVYSNNLLSYTAKYENTYNASGTYKTATTNYTCTKGSNTWSPVNMVSYNYDANNNVTGQLNQDWNTASSEFVNTDQYQFYYIVVKSEPTAITATANDFEANIYPNPSTSSQVNLRLNITDNSQVTIIVYDAMGRPISTEIRPVITGDNSITLGSGEMASGNYFVQLVDPTDGKTSVLKFIKM